MLDALYKTKPREKAGARTASEEQYGLTDNEISVLDVSGQKDHVLRLEQFDSVAQTIRPYTTSLG